MGVIESGAGQPNRAKVDSDLRLWTRAATESSEIVHTKLGYAFNINTGDITVTNATKVTLLYIKNTGTKDIIISTVIYLTGNSTNGTAATDFLWTAIVNPTAGDIIDNTNAVGMNTNRKPGSSNTLTANAYKGAVGETAVTGGTDLFGTRLASSGRTLVPISIVLSQSQSIAFDFTAKTSNTNCIVQAAVACYEQNLAS
jgi:hypothetical protein